VIDGGVRDAERMEALGFPVFSRRLCIRGTTKNREAARSIGDPVLFGDCVIHAGDIVVGDRDGLVVIATAEIDAVLRAAAEREAKEGVFLQRLSEGATTLELYGWD
jgi:4-hydroxy-4-methyl-2-oxoglutarate aldolase